MPPSHPKIPTLISWLIASFALASQSSQELDGDEAKDETPSYRQFNLHKFAAPSLATAAFAASGAIKTAPILAEDINPDFTNIEDLTWIKPHAATNQALLFGEQHYYRHIYHLRNRIFFALNRWDSYPVLVLEGNFSANAYARHCLTIEQDGEAESLARTFCPMREDVELLMHVRRWNRTFPDKPLSVIFSDIEHGLDLQPVIAFLHQADPAFSLDASKPDYARFQALYPELQARIALAKARGIIGPIPTADADYYAAVLENLNDAYKAYNFRGETFNLYRQRAIIRNLTDRRFLGKDIEHRKFMLHAGLYHAQRISNYPDGYNFLCEGSFLEYDYPPTRGRTWALNVFATEYSLRCMADKDLSKYSGYGTQYTQILGRLRQAYDAGAIGPDESVSCDPIEFYEQILWEIASAGGHDGLRVTDLNWDALGLLTKPMPHLHSQLLQLRQQFSDFDGYVFFPRSPIAELLLKDTHTTGDTFSRASTAPDSAPVTDP